MMLEVFGKEDKDHKISSHVFHKSSVYSDQRKVKKLSVLLCESLADSKVEDDFESKSGFLSIGLVDKCTKKTISGVDLLKYGADDLIKGVHELNDSQAKFYPGVAANNSQLVYRAQLDSEGVGAEVEENGKL